MGGGVYFRPTWRQVVGRGLLAALIMALIAAVFPLWETARGVFVWPDLLPVMAGFVVGALVAVPLAYRSGAAVDGLGVHPITIGRSTFGYAPWARIVDIRPERRGTRTVPVIYLDTGEMMRMRAPYTGPLLAGDRHFDEKVYMLRSMWETRRSWIGR